MNTVIAPATYHKIAMILTVLCTSKERSYVRHEHTIFAIKSSPESSPFFDIKYGTCSYI